MPPKKNTARQSFLAGYNAGGPGEFLDICSKLAENSRSLTFACYAAMGYGKKLALLRERSELTPEGLFSQAIQIASAEYVSKSLFAAASNALRSLVGHAAEFAGSSPAGARTAVIADEFASLQLDSLNRCFQSKTLQRLFPGHPDCLFAFDEIPPLALKAKLDAETPRPVPNKPPGRRA